MSIIFDELSDIFLDANADEKRLNDSKEATLGLRGTTRFDEPGISLAHDSERLATGGRRQAKMSIVPKISVDTYQVRIPGHEHLKLPDFIFHFTRLTQSMLIWIGHAPADGNGACLSSPGTNASLAKDWSCALASSSFPAVSTQLNSLNPTHTFSQSLAQKIAQRFRIQVFVSIDLPPLVLESESGVKLELEKQLFDQIQLVL